MFSLNLLLSLSLSLVPHLPLPLSSHLLLSPSPPFRCLWMISSDLSYSLLILLSAVSQLLLKPLSAKVEIGSYFCFTLPCRRAASLVLVTFTLRIEPLGLRSILGSILRLESPLGWVEALSCDPRALWSCEIQAPVHLVHQSEKPLVVFNFFSGFQTYLLCDFWVFLTFLPVYWCLLKGCIFFLIRC